MDELGNKYGKDYILNCLQASYLTCNKASRQRCDGWDTANTVADMVVGVLSWYAGPVFGVDGTIKGAVSFVSYLVNCA